MGGVREIHVFLKEAIAGHLALQSAVIGEVDHYLTDVV